MRDALSLFDQVLAFTGDEVKDDEVAGLLGLVDRELLHRASRAIVDGDSLAMLELVESLADYGADYRNFVRELLLHLREVLLVKLAPDSSPLLHAVLPEELDRLRAARERAVGGGPAARARPADAHRGRAAAHDRPARDARPRAAEARAAAAADALRRAGRARRAARRRGALRCGRAAPGARRARRQRAAAPAPRPAPVQSRPVSPAPAAAAPEPAAPAATVPAEAAGGDAGILASLIAQCQTRPSLAAPLRSAAARVEGDTLLLEVPPDFVSFATMHGEEYRELARKAAGRPLVVRVVAGGIVGGDEPAAQREADASRQKLREEAEKEPAVQEALDLFDARVVDVRLPSREDK